VPRERRPALQQDLVRSAVLASVGTMALVLRAQVRLLEASPSFPYFPSPLSDHTATPSFLFLLSSHSFILSFFSVCSTSWPAINNCTGFGGGTNTCSSNGTCAYTGPGTYSCACNPGYNGTGNICTGLSPPLSLLFVSLPNQRPSP